MTDMVSSLSLTQPVAAIAVTQKAADHFIRQAPQIVALGTTAPMTKTESSRSTNPSPIVAYDRRGQEEKDEEKTGEQLSFTA